MSVNDLLLVEPLEQHRLLQDATNNTATPGDDVFLTEAPDNTFYLLFWGILLGTLFLCGGIYSHLFKQRLRRYIEERARWEATERAVRAAGLVVAANNQEPEIDPQVRRKIINRIFPLLTSQDKKLLKFDTEAQRYKWIHKSADEGPNKHEPTCSICLEQFQKNEFLIEPKCGHLFHRNCLMGWVLKKDGCPLCRQDMWNAQDYKAVEAKVHMEMEDTSTEGASDDDAFES